MGTNLVAARQERAAVIPEIIYFGTYYETNNNRMQISQFIK